MKLSKEQIVKELKAMPGWSFQNDALSRHYAFASYADGIAFVVRLGFAAESRDHHPDLVVGYKKVGVTWSTHDEGGVTDKDLEGARQSEDIFRRFHAA
jgi:4a-hydroxytetrahydrobiopterin dehydratase